ncbi:hypothetical protein AB4059_00545 [Lysobacter sp. 2RAF19]
MRLMTILLAVFCLVAIAGHAKAADNLQNAAGFCQGATAQDREQLEARPLALTNISNNKKHPNAEVICSMATARKSAHAVLGLINFNNFPANVRCTLTPVSAVYYTYVPLTRSATMDPLSTLSLHWVALDEGLDTFMALNWTCVLPPNVGLSFGENQEEPGALPSGG